METFYIILLILLLFIPFGYLIFLIQYRIYKRRMMSSNKYTHEIIKYLEENQLKLIESKDLNKTDWNKSPFKTKRNNNFNDFLLLNIMYKHKVIIAFDKANKYVKIWLRHTLPFLGKEEIEFIQVKKRLNQNEYLLQKENVHLVTNKCPACSFELKEIENICPNCGLYFQ